MPLNKEYRFSSLLEFFLKTITLISFINLYQFEKLVALLFTLFLGLLPANEVSFFVENLSNAA